MPPAVLINQREKAFVMCTHPSTRPWFHALETYLAFCQFISGRYWFSLQHLAAMVTQRVLTGSASHRVSCVTARTLAATNQMSCGRTRAVSIVSTTVSMTLIVLYHHICCTFIFKTGIVSLRMLHKQSLIDRYISIDRETFKWMIFPAADFVKIGYGSSNKMHYKSFFMYLCGRH